VLERLLRMEEASCSCWPTWFGGSNRLSRQGVQDSKYSNRRSNFKLKSTCYAWLTSTNSITSDELQDEAMFGGGSEIC